MSNHPLLSSAARTVALLCAAAALASPAFGTTPEARLELVAEQDSRPALSRDTEVAIEVHGLVARTRVTQSFINPLDRWAEGRYVFPLPAGATVDELRIRIGDRVIEGVVREKQAARETFQQARQTGRSAGLVERHRENLFSVRLTNIAPGERIDVEIGFGQTVEYRHGEFRLRFPIPTLPRHDNRTPAAATEPSMPAALDAPALVEDRLPPTPIDPGARAPLRLRVALHAGVEIAAVRSLHHDARIRGRGSERTVELSGHAGGRDFELVWRAHGSKEIRGALFVEQAHDRAHALLMLVPPETVGRVDRKRELIVVLDRSGSMQGEAFDQARAAVELALARIGPGDRFNVIAFSSGVESLFPEPQPATNRRLEQALSFVAALDANGGTEFDAALAHAMAGRAGPGHLRQIVFVTDGAIAKEQPLLDRVERELAGARVFAVGIGHGVNDAFLAALAERGRGTLTRIADPRDVASRMGELLVQLESPVLEDVRVDWPLPAETWPARLPDLYAGEPVMVRARFDAPVARLGDGTIRVTGLRDQRFVELEWPMSRLSFASGIARSWAQARIDGLARRGPDEMDPQLQRDERLLTALDYGIVSSLTSLSAVDRTPRRSRDAALQRTEVAGTPPADRGGAIVALPATATGSVEAGLRGISILTIVLLLVFNRRLRDREPDRGDAGGREVHR